jgi:aldehyde dehydrogenase (NAD+)
MAISVLAERDALRVQSPRQFIDGEWSDGSGPDWTHVHPATGEEILSWQTSTESEVDRAVRAARRAFDDGDWPRFGARQRAPFLRRIVDLIVAHADELNRLQVLDNGMPIGVSSAYFASAAICADRFDHYAGWIDKITGQTFPIYSNEHELQYLTLLEPVGVVAGIIPWNAPLLQFAGKVAPALAAGCTIVMKPSEHAPLAAARLSELIAEADLPPGVFNLVLGCGPPTGEALITHPLVDKVNFTGSRAVGEHVLSTSGKGIKRVSLELGGKSASLVFEDANVAAAATTTMSHVSMALSGQICAAQSRAIVPEAIYDEFVEHASRQVEAVRFGDPFDAATTSAPMITEAQMNKVLGYIELGQEQGAQLLFGGDRPNGELSGGNWINPALFVEVDNRSALAQEEIFGPVLSVIRVTSEDEAIRVANASPYGLSGGIYTRDVGRALRVARALRTGTVGINDYDFFPNAPFGGYKASGLGREGGWSSIEAVVETKTVMIGLQS